MASSAPASTWARRRRPRPRSWWPGCKKSMERHQTCSRRSAATTATMGPPGPAGSWAATAPAGWGASATATQKPSGSVASRWPSSPSSGPEVGGIAGRPTLIPYSVRPACQTPTQAGRSPSWAGRSRIAGAPPGATVTSECPAISRGFGRSADRVAGRLALQLGCHEDVQVAVKDRRRVGRLHAGPVVLDHLVRVEDVAPDLVAPAGLDVLALELPQLDLLLLQAPFQEPGREHLCRGLAVLRRRALVLAGHDDPRGDVRQADGRVRLLDVLPAGPRRAVVLHPDLVPVELHLGDILHLGHHLDERERGLAAFLGIVRADPDQPVHASLGAQPAVGPPTVDVEGHALEAGLLALGLVQDLGREAVAFGPAQEHPEEHLRPVGGLGPAGTRADRHERAALVVLPGEEEGGAFALEGDAQRVGIAFDLGEHLGVVGLGGHVRELLESRRPRLQVTPQGQLALEPVGLAQDPLGTPLVVPEPGDADQRIELRDARFLRGEVKDAPRSRGSARQEREGRTGPSRLGLARPGGGSAGAR